MDKIAQSEIRKKILKIALASKEGHIASSFSIIEILLAIYEYFKIKNASNLFFERIILSKGHAVFALYAFMNHYKFLRDEEFNAVCQYGSYLIGHVPIRPDRNFFIGTGSLGQGFPIALGKAYGNSLAGKSLPTFVIIGDGELNEGSCWETLLLMKKFPNSRLTVLIDNNLSSKRAIPMEDIFSFLGNAWSAIEVDGHNPESMLSIISERSESSSNTVIICNTIKGYPLQAMMGNPIWHHKTPTEAEFMAFSKEVDVFFEVEA